MQDTVAIVIEKINSQLVRVRAKILDSGFCVTITYHERETAVIHQYVIDHEKLCYDSVRNKL